MKFKDFLFGSEDKVKQLSSKTPEQMDAIIKMLQGGGLEGDELYGAGSDWIKKLLGGDFSAFEAPLMNQFNEQVVPGIAERFAGVGAMSSSGLNQALAQASKGLMTELGAQRAGLMANMVPQALSYAQQPQTNRLAAMQMDPYKSENYIKQGQQGQFGNLFNIGKNYAQGSTGGSESLWDLLKMLGPLAMGL